MKRKVLGTLALLCVCMLLAFGFTACEDAGNGGDHLHTYEEIVSPEYLKSAATCENAAVYYKSCSGCEAKSEETFEYGTALGHSYENGVCTECGGKENGSDGGETHEHSYSSDWTIDIEATCTAKGEKSHHCTVEGCTAKSDVTEIDFAEHRYSSEWTIDIEATCTEKGEKSHHCTVEGCTARSEVTEIDFADHTYSSEWTIDRESTCTAKGEKSHHCTVEGCTAKADVTEIDFADHNYSSEWTVDIEATCTAKGEKSHHCMVEGCAARSEVTEIDFAEHSYSTEWTIDRESTCTVKGEKSHHCMVEGCTAKSDVTEIDLAEHNYVDGVCTECGDKKGLEEATGLSYTLSSDGTYYIVSGIGTEARTAFAVPATYNGKPVKEIRYDAFSRCSSLTSIEIPDSVTSIGEDAFSECSRLTSVTFGENSALTNIGRYAFSGCTNLQYTVYENAKYLGNSTNPYVALIEAVDRDVSTCTIHEDTKMIADEAFYRCSSLTSIEIPSGVTSIGDNAFYRCSSLTSVYYAGSAEDWDKISIGYDNYELTSATVYYYSESNPFEGENAVTSGNYWHYDENGEIVVW